MKTNNREWQTEAVARAASYYEGGGRNFLINAAPGAGKTYAASLLAKHLIDAGKLDRVVVIAPRKKIATQWAKQFKRVTERTMMKVTGKVMTYEDPETMEEDICATWAGVQMMSDAMQAICRHHRTMVIGDEVHHAALGAVWGDGTHHAFDQARYVLALTGTPQRSDGKNPIWLDESTEMEIGQFYNVSYEYAIEKGWCVPAVLHRHCGEIEVDLGVGIARSTENGLILPPRAEEVLTPPMKRKLRFDRLVNLPLLEDDEKTPRAVSFHSTMLDWANDKLDDLRSRKHGEFGMPNAGALVIAPNIPMAEYFKALIERLWPEENVTLVTSKLESEYAERQIDKFAKAKRKWIVSVNMISEGVDIPRLRVLVYLPGGRTELNFRQAIGRIIRKDESNGDPELDNSRAYCVMPSISEDLVNTRSFVEFALALEGEMPPVEPPPPPQCPECKAPHVRPSRGSPCPHCGYEPPYIEVEGWTCSTWSDEGCGALNDPNKQHCHHCGLPKQRPLSLKAASGWRDGAITREMELSEEETQESEELAPELYARAAELNDPRLTRMLRVVPEESLSLLEKLYRRVN